jgi:hypothetical protein
LRRCWQYLVLKMKKRSFTMINIKKMRLTMFAASIVAAGALTGCFNDKSADPGTTGFGLGAAKGAINGATCTYKTALNTDGFAGKTDANGEVQVAVTPGFGPNDYPVVITCVAGTYFDEFDNNTKPQTEPMRSVIPDAQSIAEVGGKIGVNVFTELATALFESLPAGAANRTAAAAKGSYAEIGRLFAPGMVANGGSLNLMQASTPVNSATPTLGANVAGQLATYLAGFAKYAATIQGGTSMTLLADLSAKIAAGTAIPADVAQGIKTEANTYTPGSGTGVTAQPTGNGGTAQKPAPGGTTTGGTGGTGGTGAGGSDNSQN